MPVQLLLNGLSRHFTWAAKRSKKGVPKGTATCSFACSWTVLLFHGPENVYHFDDFARPVELGFHCAGAKIARERSGRSVAQFRNCIFNGRLPDAPSYFRILESKEKSNNGSCKFHRMKRSNDMVSVRSFLAVQLSLSHTMYIFRLTCTDMCCIPPTEKSKDPEKNFRISVLSGMLQQIYAYIREILPLSFAKTLTYHDLLIYSKM